MPDFTPIDAAHSAMMAAQDDTALRLEFYERLSDNELFLLLEKEPVDDLIVPMIFPVAGEQYALVFDREERLAEFSETIASYAALPGRTIAKMLSGQGVGLGVNLEVAPSSILIPPTAVAWLADISSVKPAQTVERPVEIGLPYRLPAAVLKSLDTKLAMAGALARSAFLVSVRYESGRRGHLLGFVDIKNGARAALSNAVSEAMAFSGASLNEIDVAFFAKHDPLCARMAKVGLKFDLPDPIKETQQPKAPGMDPDKPPLLR